MTVTDVTPPPIRVRGEALRSPKGHLDVTHRSRSPEATWELIKDELHRYGITRVADITGLDRLGIPVFYAPRPNGKSLSSSSGKGATLMASRVSAAMEGIEIALWEEERADVRIARHAELLAEGSVAPLDALFSKHSLFHDDLELCWIEAWDIVQQRPLFVPSTLIEYFQFDRLLTHWNCFSVSSNGLASGNTLLEAVTAGLLEVIERDAVACTNARHGDLVNTPRIDFSTIEDERIGTLVEQFRRADVEPILYDCTTDMGVPVYVAMVFDRATPEVGIFRGYGSHLDPSIAAIRALTEAAQSRTLIISGARDDIFGVSRSVATKFDAGESALPYLAQPPGRATLRPDESTSTFEGDIAKLVGALGSVGLHHVLVYDHTRDGSHPVHVARVIVPGCEGYLFDHYTPGPRARQLRRERDEETAAA